MNSLANKKTNVIIMEETNTQQEPTKFIHKPGHLQIGDNVGEAQKITYAIEKAKFEPVDDKGMVVLLRKIDK